MADEVPGAYGTGLFYKDSGIQNYSMKIIFQMMKNMTRGLQESSIVFHWKATAQYSLVE